MFKNRLFDQIYGCIAASNIGSAMGAPVEGWPTQRIVDEYGLLEEMLPYAHYGNYNRPNSGRDRVPGTTEDGIERQRLLISAIKEKNGRINADDLAKIWLRDINPDNFAVQMEPCDEPLYNIVKTGVHPTEAGRYSNFLGIVSFARSCHPVGLINAGNSEQAIQDTFELGRLYQPPFGYGLDWAAANAAAIAEALKPGATVDSVIAAGLNALPEGDLNQHPRAEVEKALKIADKVSDPLEMRWEFNKIYYGRGNIYEMSMGHEIIGKCFAIFKATKGDPREAIITSVNFGRDTDCLAATAGGLAGALNGTASIPQEWIDTVDKATEINEFTVSKLSLKESAEIIYKALLNDLKMQQERINGIKTMVE